ncbi:hypothetical protein MY10362_005430 [Beauveria mimosiformis]
MASAGPVPEYAPPPGSTPTSAMGDKASSLRSIISKRGHHAPPSASPGDQQRQLS